MNDYLFLMHDAVPSAGPGRQGQWSTYLGKLREAGALEGGSAIGGGVCVSKAAVPPPITPSITGYLRIQAESLGAARALIPGNPVYETGGTVEIRELPRTD
jgi:hypothetical protein